MAMEAEEEHGTLLRRVLKRAARAARAVVRISATTASSSSSPAPAAAPPGCSRSSRRLSRTTSLLDCMDDDDDGGESSSLFYTPASSPVVAKVVHYPRCVQQPSLSPSPVGAAADIDRRAAEFIERFRRNESLELRYCAVYSPLTPVKPPMSPDTYFKLSGVHHGAAAGGSPAAYVRKMSSLRPSTSRRSGISIKWPTAGRPTVRI